MNPQTIEIKLTGTCHRWAKLFASKQLDVPRGRQVYLNTLSILAIEEYLQSIGIATDIESSRSWYPTPLDRSADLQLVDLGSIAAIPQLPAATQILPFTEPSSDCIAYIAVSLNEALDSATILGFLPVAEIDRDKAAIDLATLQPIADLPNYLGKIRDGYGLLETDSDIVTELLAEINERCLPRFLAESYQIVSSDKTSMGKRIDMQDTIDSAYAVSGLRRHAGVNEAERLDNDRKSRDLAKRWLDLLSGIWTPRNLG
jgi:hypothetical protein